MFWRYTYLYIWVRKYESGGLMWPFVYSRMIILFGVFGVLTACVLVVKKAYPQVSGILDMQPVFIRNIVGKASVYRRYISMLRPPTAMLGPDSLPASASWGAESRDWLFSHSM